MSEHGVDLRAGHTAQGRILIERDGFVNWVGVFALDESRLWVDWWIFRAECWDIDGSDYRFFHAERSVMDGPGEPFPFESEPAMEGFTKWDGCTETWSYGDHTCSAGSFRSKLIAAGMALEYAHTLMEHSDEAGERWAP